MASALRSWCPEIVALASDLRQIMRGGSHMRSLCSGWRERESAGKKTKEGKREGEKGTCSGSERTGETQQVRGRPTSERRAGEE